MIDCRVCIHYDCCCGWTSKEVIDSLAEAMEDGDCRECNYYEPKKIGKWIPASTKPGVYAGMKCSECKARITYSEHNNGQHLYCHKCGAQMLKE